MTLRRAVALTPLVFLAHDAEEIATVERWTRAHAGLFPPPLRAHLPVPTAHFATGVAVFFAALVVVSLLAFREPRPGPATRVWIVAVGALLANAATHPVQALAAGGYVPGVVTAVVLVLPFTLLALRRAVGDGAATRRGALAACAAGLVLQAPLALLALAAGRVLGG